MKKLLLFLFLLTAAKSHADFSISWSTIASGGGQCSAVSAANVAWKINGTIGQCSPAASSTNPFSITGGFWAQIIYPELLVAPARNGALSVQWSDLASGWRLESSSNLATWNTISESLVGEGSYEFTPSIGAPRQFFRLSQP